MVIVDPYSSGRTLVRELKERGIPMVAVQSSLQLAHFWLEQLQPEYFETVIVHDGDNERTYELLRQWEAQFVAAGRANTRSTSSGDAVLVEEQTDEKMTMISVGTISPTKTCSFGDSVRLTSVGSSERTSDSQVQGSPSSEDRLTEQETINPQSSTNNQAARPPPGGGPSSSHQQGPSPRTAFAAPREITAVVPGSEPGVLLAEDLQELFGSLYSNGAETKLWRRHKYTQIERLRDAGLRATRQTFASTAEEAVAWQRGNNKGKFPVVVKPAMSGGTDGVYVCNTDAEIYEAFRLECGKVNVNGELCGPDISCYDLQRLGGTELVDRVSVSGEGGLSTSWKAAMSTSWGEISTRWEELRGRTHVLVRRLGVCRARKPSRRCCPAPPANNPIHMRPPAVRLNWRRCTSSKETATLILPRTVHQTCLPPLLVRLN